eukprot:3369673-Pyramimonas_sp.AAC.1
MEGLAQDVLNDALDDVWDGLEDLRRIYDEQHVTINVSALDDSIRYMGRHVVDAENGSILFDNTGFVIGFRVKGTSTVGMRYREVRNVPLCTPSLHVPFPLNNRPFLERVVSSPPSFHNVVKHTVRRE